MNTLSHTNLSIDSSHHPLAHLIVARMRQDEMDIRTVLAAMGYQSRSDRVLFNAAERLQRVLSDDYLGLYEHQHCYDMKFTAEEFVEALCQAVNLKSGEYGQWLWELIALKPRDQYRFRLRADIHSDILKQSNPRFLLGMQLHPFIDVALVPYFHLKDFAEQDRITQVLSAQHYLACNNTLPMQSVIRGYLLYYTQKGEDEVLYRRYECPVVDEDKIAYGEGKFAMDVVGRVKNDKIL